MAGSVILSILSTYNSKGTKEAEKSLEALSKSVKGMTKNLTMGFSAWKLYNSGIAFIKSSVTAATDLQRAQNGLQTIFGNMTPVMQKYIDKSADIGLSHFETAKSLTLVGALFKNLGFPMSVVADHSQKIITLSSDLASTFGGTTSDALFSLASAFKGIYRPMEKYGIGISANQIKTELAAKGYGKLKGEMLLAATMQQRYTDIIRLSGDAHGAFTRQLGSLFEQEQILNAGFTDLKSTIGQAMLDPMAALIQILNPLIQNLAPHLIAFFQTLAGLVTSNTGSFAGFADQIMAFIDQITNFVKSVGPGFMALAGFLANNLSWILKLIIAVKIWKTSFGVLKSIIKLTTVETEMLTAATSTQTGAAISQSLAMDADSVAIRGYLGATVGATAATDGLKGSIIALEATNPLGWIALAITGFIAFANAAGDAGRAQDNFNQKQGGNARSFSGATLSKYIPNAPTTTFTSINAIERNMPKLSTKSLSDMSASELQKWMADFQTKTTGALTNGSKTVNPIVAAAKKMASDFASASKEVGDALSASYNSIVGAFDITQFGASKDTMAQNMGRFMDRLRQFAGYIRQLKSANLNPALIAQIISAGPVNGMAAAAALAGNSDLRHQANVSYGEVGSLAQDLAKSSLTKQQAAIYNITVKGGIGTGTSIGKEVVEAIKAYERTNGKGWRG